MVGKASDGVDTQRGRELSPVGQDHTQKGTVGAPKWGRPKLRQPGTHPPKKYTPGYSIGTVVLVAHSDTSPI